MINIKENVRFISVFLYLNILNYFSIKSLSTYLTCSIPYVLYEIHFWWWSVVVCFNGIRSNGEKARDSFSEYD